MAVIGKRKPMKNHYTLLFFLLSLLASTLCRCTQADVSTAPRTRLTSVQAAAVAVAFCRHVGVSITQPAVANFPASSTGVEETYWQPRWEVTFPGEAELEVVDATGVITRFKNRAYFSRHDLTPESEAISQEEAIRRATLALKATGLPESVAFWRASLSQMTSPPLATTHEWEVLWQRVVGGIHYRHQHVAVGLDAQTGELKNLVVMFPSPPATTGTTAISQDQAVETARLRLTSAGLPEMPLQSARLEIVRTGTASPSPKTHKQQRGTARAVWSCLFRGKEHVYDVWVDVETGQVVGGESYSGGGLSSKVIPMPVLTALRHGNSYRMERRNAAGDWMPIPSTLIDMHSHPELFRLLRGKVQWQAVGPGGVPLYQLVISSQGGSVLYTYFPESGLVGGGNDWAMLPAKATSWLKPHLVP